MTDSVEAMVKALWVARDRLEVKVFIGDALLHLDTFNPAVHRSVRSFLKVCGEKAPAINLETLEAIILGKADQKPNEQTEVNTSGGSVTFEDPEPWGEPVEGAGLLDEIKATFERYVVLPEGGSTILPLWILHTYATDCFDISPRLLLTSPEMRCGKSRVLRLTGAHVRRPVSCENVSAAALYRMVEKYRPTLLLDEGDTFLIGKHASDELKGVVNAGHLRGGQVVRCVGDDHEPMTFSVYGPVAIAMIGRPYATLLDRSVEIQLRRKSPGERVDSFRVSGLSAMFRDTRRRCVRWSRDSAQLVADLDPEIPAGLDDRAADNLRPLLAIAHAAGGTWPEDARQAARELSRSREEEISIGTLLLRDLREIFEAPTRRALPRLLTEKVLEILHGMEDRPWPEYARSKRPVSAHVLSRILRPYGVRPEKWRDEAGKTRRGYARADLEDLWIRYIPPAPPFQSATSATSLSSNDLRRHRSATEKEPVAVSSCQKSFEDNVVALGALQTKGEGGPKRNGAPSGGPPHLPCRVCGGTRLWRGTGSWTCRRCHPPAVPEAVAEEFDLAQTPRTDPSSKPGGAG